MVMLLLCALQPKNIIKQEVVLVLGREPEHLGSGTVQNDLLEHPISESTDSAMPPSLVRLCSRGIVMER